MAQPALTETERTWLDAARPVLVEAARTRLPLDVIVQPQPNAGEPTVAMGFVGGRCKLVLTMRGSHGAPLPAAEVDPALPRAYVEAIFAHEVGHCWRHASGAWHAWPAAFSGSTARPRAGRADAEAARREEGFADLVALAWTLRRDPGRYRAVHDWLLEQRAVPDGAEHDTRAWLRRARDPGAFPAHGTVFEQAQAVWAASMTADDGSD